MKDTINAYKENVDNKLIIRQALFLVIILVCFGISIFNVYFDKISVVLALNGFLLSTLIGVGLSRMFKISWHDQKEVVTSHLDTLGGVLLAIYIIAEISRKWIFEHWLSGAELNAFGLVVISGLLLGRFLGTGFRINHVLNEKNKLE